MKKNPEPAVIRKIEIPTPHRLFLGVFFGVFFFLGESTIGKM
jgi:hypothetical protein